MILDLDNPTAQDRYIPDVRGFNFSVLMPDPFARKGVRLSGVRGIGRLARIAAVLQYCQNHPPDAETQAIIAARGDSVSLVPCGYSTGGTAETGFRPATAAEIAAQDPYGYGWHPPVPTYTPAAVPACDPLDIACVARATAIQTQNQIDFGEKQADVNRELCLANGTDAATCAARWPAGYTGDTPATNLTPQQVALNTNETVTAYDYTPLYAGGPVPMQFEPSGAATPYPAGNQAQATTATNRPNQSVPPTSQITTIPTLPASPPTRQVLTSAYSAGSVTFPAGPAGSQLIPGVDNTKLLVGAGLLVAVLMAVKR